MSFQLSNKIAFVIPWYAADIPGGAESACRNLAERLKKNGEEVEILTTCVKQFNSDWNTNYYKPGEEIINGVLVRRFKVKKRNTSKFDEVNAKLMMGAHISSEEEKVFLDEMVNSTDLEDFINNSNDEYKAFIFTPYMFGTTYNGMKQVLKKSILLPAFHDESYAYFEAFKELYSKVKGMIFFSTAERDFANQVYNLKNVKQSVLGLGIESFKTNPENFRNKFNIGNSPYILYAGRKDMGKNVHVLIDYFMKFISNKKIDVKLILIGGGSISIPNGMESNIIDLGFVDEQDKFDAYGGAEFLCNPSLYESFSIVIMESWYSGRPVVVAEKCEVTKRFCEYSNGGLYFNNYAEFEMILNLLLTNKKLSANLGNFGKFYVEENFVWDKVINKYQEFIKLNFEESL